MNGKLAHMKQRIKASPLGLRLWRTLRAARDLVFQWRFRDKYHEAVFTQIWRENRWLDGESRSGPGSNFDQTEVLRAGLADVVKELSTRSLLDVPCGDFHWMKEVRFSPDFVYTGGDIVAPLIKANNERYGDEIRSFKQIDILRDPLPKADLILCRDCLVHLSFHDVVTAINNYKKSGATYLLLTHFKGERKNIDITTGDWRTLNFIKAPFYFPPPLRLIDENCPDPLYRDKTLALWRLKDLPASISIK
jgi:hypothetical protein